jgi:hypothetical protein
MEFMIIKCPQCPKLHFMTTDELANHRLDQHELKLNETGVAMRYSLEHTINTIGSPQAQWSSTYAE